LLTVLIRFTRLEAAIKKAIPDAEVTGSVGRAQSFEVTVNGQLVFSKLQTGSFPDDTKVREPSCWHRFVFRSGGDNNHKLECGLKSAGY
uniref:Selenoprotein n=1 Tax=Gadus morhua TaxID=8049 RepID=A0A8C5BJM6_GADMO